AYNEQENIELLLNRVSAALGQLGTSFEVVIVDDGSSDATPQLLAEAKQKDPEEIPRLLPLLNGYDMIAGWRQKRHDTAVRRIQSRIANRIRNWISQEDIHDSACSLKLYRRQCLEGLQLYNGMHRFMPTLVKMRGYTVREEPVKHSARYAGKAKYGLRNRALRAFVDLLAVRWMKMRYIRYDVKEVSLPPEAAPSFPAPGTPGKG